ncbi:ABC-three component system middle component 5 [Roseovarius sp. EL26]|uniref:ABC-three component system middle component 5 n=1 Tax=Roseovarius sp. EL26 TaxID=2126672 RepID=UPI000EA13516
MTELRIWHSSRDPYHCVFRMLRLLMATQEGLPLERLRILDMYLLYPPLLHRLSLPKAIKEKFRELKIENPKSTFVKLPSNASVWQNLQVYQSASLKQLIGRGLLDQSAFQNKIARLLSENLPTELAERVAIENAEDSQLISLLVEGMSVLSMSGPAGLIRRSGIPARGPVL